MTFTKRRSRSNRPILLFQLKVFRNEKMELVLFVYSALAVTTLVFLSGCNPSQSDETADQTAPRVEGEKGWWRCKR